MSDTARECTRKQTHTPLALPGLITGPVLWMSTFSIGVQGEESGLCEPKWEKIYPEWFKWFILSQDNTGTERKEKHILIGWGNRKKRKESIAFNGERKKSERKEKTN